MNRNNSEPSAFSGRAHREEMANTSDAQFRGRGFSTNFPMMQRPFNEGNFQPHQNGSRINADVRNQNSSNSHNNLNPTFPSSSQNNNCNPNYCRTKNCCGKEDGYCRERSNRQSFADERSPTGSSDGQFQTFPFLRHPTNIPGFNPPMPMNSQYPSYAHPNNNPIPTIANTEINISAHSNGNQFQLGLFHVQCQTTFQQHFNNAYSTNPAPTLQNTVAANLNISSTPGCSSGISNMPQNFNFSVNNYAQNYNPIMSQSNVAVNNQQCAAQMSINCVNKKEGVFLSVMGRAPNTMFDQQCDRNILPSGNAGEVVQNEGGNFRNHAQRANGTDSLYCQGEMGNPRPLPQDDVVVLYDSSRDKSALNFEVSRNERVSNKRKRNSSENRNLKRFSHRSEKSFKIAVETKNDSEKRYRKLGERCARRKNGIGEDRRKSVGKGKERRIDVLNIRDAAIISNNERHENHREREGDNNEDAMEDDDVRNGCDMRENRRKSKNRVSEENHAETVEETNTEERRENEPESNEDREGNGSLDEDQFSSLLEKLFLTNNGLPVYLGDGVSITGLSPESAASIRDMWKTLLITQGPNLQLKHFVMMLANRSSPCSSSDRNNSYTLSAKDIEEILSRGDDKTVETSETLSENASPASRLEQQPENTNKSTTVQKECSQEESFDSGNSSDLSDARTITPPPAPLQESKRSKKGKSGQRKKTSKGKTKKP